MARQNKNLVDIANETGLKYQTLREKISGNSHFVLWEIMKIKNALGVEPVCHLTSETCST